MTFVLVQELACPSVHQTDGGVESRDEVGSAVLGWYDRGDRVYKKTGAGKYVRTPIEATGVQMQVSTPLQCIVPNTAGMTSVLGGNNGLTAYVVRAELALTNVVGANMTVN